MVNIENHIGKIIISKKYLTELVEHAVTVIDGCEFVSLRDSDGLQFLVRPELNALKIKFSPLIYLDKVTFVSCVESSGE